MESAVEKLDNNKCDPTNWSKIHVLGLHLKQASAIFQDVMQEFQELKLQSESYKSQYLSQREQCESKSCKSSVDLKETVGTKENIIQLVAATLTRFDETKNFKILKEVFKILCGEITTFTPPKDKDDVELDIVDFKTEVTSKSSKSPFSTPKTRKNTSISDVSIDEDSVSEIEGTPTGRISPIILSKIKSRKTTEKSEVGVKKKCSGNWATPDNKFIKLSFPLSKSSPSKSPRGQGQGKLKQSRLNLVRNRPKVVVDLTCSPDLGGARAQGESGNKVDPDNKFIKLSFPLSKSSPSKSPRGQGQGKLKQSRLNLVRNRPKVVVDLTCSPDLGGARAQGESGNKVDISTIKKESLENDDTILPSPTSNPLQNKYFVHKPNGIRSSPRKIKESPEVKTELQSTTFTEPNVETKLGHNTEADVNATRMEESTNLLNPFRFPSSPKKKVKVKLAEVNENTRHLDTGDDGRGSLSILEQVDHLERHTKNNNDNLNLNSPTKSPLAENVNLTNMACQSDSEASMSVLHRELRGKENHLVNNGDVQRKTPEKVEPIFKEPTVRKKAEKIKLPGWSCEECRIFYDELYKDQPEILAKLMDECSKHRGRRNPARPATPPGYWYPRWDVPDDTEAFNKRNNAN